MSKLTRRRLIAGLCGTSAVAIAGCTSSEASEDGTRLHSVSVVNRHDDSHTVDVLIEYEDEINHWSTHTLGDDGENNDVVLEQEWPNEAGEFKITVRLDESEVIDRTPEDFNHPECLELKIEIEPNAELNVWGVLDSSRCLGED